METTTPTASRAEPTKFNFTKAALEGRECPEGKIQLWVYDEGQPGLACCIGAGGRKTFYSVKKRGGVPDRVKLGVFYTPPKPGEKVEPGKVGKANGMTIEQARIDARAEAVKVDRNEPSTNDVKAAKRAEWTLQQLFDWFIVQPTGKKEKRTRKPKTEAEYRKQFAKYLADWHGKRIGDITFSDVDQLHAKLGDKKKGKGHGPYMANRVVALLKAMFNAVIKRGGFESANPAAGVTMFPEDQRVRHIHADEFPKFKKALDALPDPMFRDFFWLVLLTGQRRSNVQAMAWDQISFARKEWTIPGDQAKAHEPIVVQLTPDAMKILRRRRGEIKDSPWVFPTRSETGHLMEPKAAWREVCTAAGLADVRIHDLRHTYATWLLSTGASLPFIGQALGHRSPQSTLRYAHVDVSPLRTAVTAGVSAMMAATKPKPAKGKRKGVKKKHKPKK